MSFCARCVVMVLLAGLAANACAGTDSTGVPQGAAGNGAGASSAGGLGQAVGGAGAGHAGAAGSGVALGGASGSGSDGKAGAASAGATMALGGASSGGTGSGGKAGAEEKAGTGGTADSGAASVQHLQPVISAFCAAARSCCAKQGETATLDDCETAFAKQNSTVSSLASGAATLDAAALATCLAAYQTASTQCEENSVLSACRGVVIGTRAENAPCTSGTECIRTGGINTCLITEQGGTVGVCKKIPHYKAGDACSFTCRKGEDCTSSTYGAPDSMLGMCFEDDGVYCDSSADVAQCKAVLAPGASCSTDAECGSTGYCQTTCQKRGNVGDPCTRCLDSLTCVDNHCVSPPFGSSYTCAGGSLGPY